MNKYLGKKNVIKFQMMLLLKKTKKSEICEYMNNTDFVCVGINAIQ